MKILVLDIETSPIKCYTWGIWQQNINPSMIINDIKIMSIAAKWLGEKQHFFMSTQHATEKALLKEFNKLLDEADIVIGHNVKGFDMKHIRGRSLTMGFKPPSPYKEIDTLTVARSNFKFTSNKLGELAKMLGVKQKSSHKKFPGFMLWEACMAGNDAAWHEMEVYNIDDVDCVEEVYLMLRPYMKTHPNVAIFSEGDEVRCPKCDSTDSMRRGFSFTNSGKYQRYQCKSCGGWHRGRLTVYDKVLKRSLATNVN